MLCFVCLSLTVIRFSYDHFINPDPIIIKNLPLIERKLNSANENNYYAPEDYKKGNGSNKLFQFDPNTIAFNELLDLGFTEKTARIFLKFRSKGFVFKQKQDLKKVFGVSDNFYQKLEAYILIKDPGKEERNNKITKKNTELFEVEKNQSIIQNNNVELNSADSLMLLKINGIGPSFTKRILKYRFLLGGFIRVEQLKEVYGFTDEIYDKVKSQVSVNANAIKKINLNKDDFKTVNKHPYISYELTKSIFDLRRKTTITKDNISGILNDETLYKKLIDYLEF